VPQTKWWWCDFDVGFYRAGDSSEWHARHAGGWHIGMECMVCRRSTVQSSMRGVGRGPR